MKKLLAFVSATTLLTISCIASAHTDLASSSPANGAVVNHAPGKVELQFTEEVRLLKFSVTGSKGSNVATEFKPSADTLEHFTIALPALAEDSYTVHWSATGDDSHLVEKTFAFTVDADAKEVSGAAAAPEATHSHSH